MSKNYALSFDALGTGSGQIVTQVFLTDDGVDGQLLWAIDDTGIPALLATIDPGPNDLGAALDPLPVGQIVSTSPTTVGFTMATAFDGTLGQQLWRTDGTASGTSLVLSLDSGPGTKNDEFSYSNPTNAVVTTDDGVHGQKIWVTDGTTTGTQLLATVDTGVEPAGSEFLSSGIGYSYAAGLPTAPYYFVMYDQTVGQELWASDGTAVNTHVVATLQSGPGIKSVAPFGTAIVDGATWHDVFVADDGVHGQQIWSTDGTTGGTARLATVDSGSEPLGSTLDPTALYPSLAGPSFPSGEAAFVLYDKTLGQQLWVADATSATLVLTLNAGPGIKNDSTFSFSVDGHAVFVTDDGVHGQTIWTTDGTTSGTTVLGTADAGTEPSGGEFVPSAIGFTATGAGLFALYDQTDGQQLWTTDGTAGGTHVVLDLDGSAGIKSYATQGLALASGAVVFAADDGVHGQQIWSSDGTGPGTMLLASVPSVATSTGPDHDPVLMGYGTQSGSLDNTRVFFSLEDGQELWSTDGTPAGTIIEEALVCFLSGTLIATPDGDVPVERLIPGDPIVTLSGAVRRIVWMGEGRVMATRGCRSAATPVVVRRGAFADNVPHRDLRVTKGHSFLIDGVLIPVEFLVNHRSILWDDHAQEVVLHHIELETHDILMANGAPAESYRDDGNRWLFRNANSGWGFPPKEVCAPVLTGGPRVDAAWQRLLDRAGPRPGVPLTSEPDLHLMADGRRIDATFRNRGTFVFRLPAPATTVRIVSRAAVPAELGVARDSRQLGVALRAIVLRHGSRIRPIGIADPRLTKGFHDCEETERIRWTDGDALLPLACLAELPNANEVVLTLGGSTRYVEAGALSHVA
jgi:ELWxxDGT repeat protein